MCASCVCRSGAGVRVHGCYAIRHWQRRTSFTGLAGLTLLIARVEPRTPVCWDAPRRVAPRHHPLSIRTDVNQHRLKGDQTGLSHQAACNLRLDPVNTGPNLRPSFLPYHPCVTDRLEPNERRFRSPSTFHAYIFL